MSTTGRENAGRFWLLHAILPLGLAAVSIALFEGTNLDRRVLDPFFDPVTRTFPLRTNHWFTLVFKNGMKDAVIAFGVAVAIGLAVSFRRPSLAPWRRTMVFVLLCLALGPLAVGALKYSSCKYCPWDLEIYGGFAPHLGLFGCGPPGLDDGECFPSGHASGGFALFALYFAERLRAPRRARLWFWIAALYGTVMGSSRMMQGAHFVSHTVATGFVCWFVCLVVYELVLHRADERRFAA